MYVHCAVLCATVVHSAVVCWLDLAFLWLYCVLQFICVRFSFLGLFCVYVCMCAFVLLDLVSSVLCKRLAGSNVSEMTSFMLSGT